jgi:hypothetical protein
LARRAARVFPPRREGRALGRPLRLGVATLDYVLVSAVVLPLIALLMWIGPRIIRLAYEMVCMLVSWPFM